MSFALMGAVYKTDVGDALAKLVLLVIAEHANTESGECWPSITRIQKVTHLSRQTVVNKLDYLERNGFIHRDKSKRRSNTYTLLVNQLDQTSLAGRPEPVSKPNNNRYPIPHDWVASDELRNSISEEIDHDTEQVKFRNYWQADGRVQANWDARYRVWCSNVNAFTTISGGRSSGGKRTTSNRHSGSFFSDAARDLSEGQG